MKKLSTIFAIIRGMLFRGLHQKNIVHPRICRGGNEDVLWKPYSHSEGSYY